MWSRHLLPLLLLQRVLYRSFSRTKGRPLKCNHHHHWSSFPSLSIRFQFHSPQHLISTSRIVQQPSSMAKLCSGTCRSAPMASPPVHPATTKLWDNGHAVNGQLTTTSRFPFTKFTDVNNPLSTKPWSSSDIVGSQGVFKGNFIGITNTPLILVALSPTPFIRQVRLTPDRVHVAMRHRLSTVFSTTETSGMAVHTTSSTASSRLVTRM